MFVLISFCPLCHPECWGTTTSLVRCLGSWHQSSLMESCSIFRGVQDCFTAPCKQAESQHCLLWSGVSPEASGWSLKQEMLRKGVGCLPWCSWRIWVGWRGQGGGRVLFPVGEEMQPKDIPDLKELYQHTESTCLVAKGGGRRLG